MCREITASDRDSADCILNSLIREIIFNNVVLKFWWKLCDIDSRGICSNIRGHYSSEYLLLNSTLNNSHLGIRLKGILSEEFF